MISAANGLGRRKQVEGGMSNFGSSSEACLKVEETHDRIDHGASPGLLSTSFCTLYCSFFYLVFVNSRFLFYFECIKFLQIAAFYSNFQFSSFNDYGLSIIFTVYSISRSSDVRVLKLNNEEICSSLLFLRTAEKVVKC